MKHAMVMGLLCLLSTVRGDMVLWDYPLTEEPPGWIVRSYAWTFTPEGMNCFFYGSSWNSYSDKGNADVDTDTLIVPPGTDSLELSVQQVYDAYSNIGGGVGAFIQLWTYENGWVSLWSLSGEQIVTDPVNLTINSISPGEQLVFRFRGYGSAGGGSGCSFGLDWTLSNLVLTAHGDIQALEPSTWAGIKTLKY